MKKLIYLLAIFAISSSMAFATQKVSIVSNNYDLTKSTSENHFVLNTMPAVESGSSFDNKDCGLPSMLLAAPENVFFRSFGDSVETLRYSSKVAADTITIGTRTIPRPLLGDDIQNGFAQFFPPMNGTLAIDSIRFILQPYSDYNYDVDQNFLVFPVSLPNHNIDEGISFEIEDEETVEYLLDESYHVIPREDIINTVQTQPTFNLSDLTVKFQNPIQIEMGKNFGFIITPEDYESTDFTPVGTFSSMDFNKAANKHYGCLVTSDGETIMCRAGTGYLSWLNTGTFATNFPELAGQPFAFDINMVVFALFEVSAVQESETPAPFNLEQNTPNPVVDNTKITFSLLTPGSVNLSVYNQMGQMVLELVNESMTPGTYSVDAVTSELPSGTYFYNLKCNGHSTTKTMQIVR